MKQSFIRRRWMNFRHGHGMYLFFALGFTNFVLIFHRLLIEQVPTLEAIFPKLWIFALVFVLGYIPVAVLVGWWHMRTQLHIEQEIFLRENPYLARIFRGLFDAIDGKLSKEEMQSFRNMLKSIEEGKGSSTKSKSETKD